MSVNGKAARRTLGDSADANGDRPPLSRRMALGHSVTIEAPAEAVWRFLENLETNYASWHPADHKAFRWTGGTPLAKGNGTEFTAVTHIKVRPAVKNFLQGRNLPFDSGSRPARSD